MLSSLVIRFLTQPEHNTVVGGKVSACEVSKIRWSGGLSRKNVNLERSSFDTKNQLKWGLIIKLVSIISWINSTVTLMMVS